MTDSDYDDTVIVKVVERDKGWEITRREGWLFYVPKEYGIEPKVGDTARFYPAGIGYTVRGLVIGGRIVYYRTAEEDAEYWRSSDND